MGFRKAKAEQAYLKLSAYGPQGSGKTLSSLLFAEGLAKHSKKRIAYIDTERGTDFYCQHVPERTVHPAEFDFDAIYTKSLTEVLRECKSLNPKEHGILVVDSITHLWESAKNSYSGKMTKVGGIPMHAWQKIKAPYKELMNFLINCPMHVIILGRQGNDFVEDEDTGESKAAGFKMKAESETPYEPHICIRMIPVKEAKKKEQVITAFVEKDRTGILSGKTIEWPSFDNMVAPLLKLLGDKQAHVQTDEEASLQDSEELSKQAAAKAKVSQGMLDDFRARFTLAKTKSAVEEVSKEITSTAKKMMLTNHVQELRNAYLEALERVGG